ncbi:MAG: heavy metal-binding domain-containing protein [Deltaproteobacteria bacterium]|nr:heavy metal-binding domain-containing protein [Deltaproteobacteria bacterium]
MKKPEDENPLEELHDFAKELDAKEGSEEAFDSPYALLIEDLDREQDRERVYQVLSESGVELDLDSIKRQLHEGHVLVSHLNEAKAAILTDKLKDIEADIRFGLLDDLLHKGKTQSAQERPILTTAPSLPEAAIKRYLGIVSTEVSMSEALVLEEIDREVGEGRSPSEYDLLVSKVSAQLKIKAQSLNADAVIAISFDFKFLPEKKSFVIFATGTAVEI